MRSVSDLMDLKGRVALITGGAGHVGRAMAEALAELGAALALLDVDETVTTVAEQVKGQYGVPVVSLRVDLADEAEIGAVPQQVVDRLGALDILVNNAALVGGSDLQGWAVPLEDQSPATWRMALEVNLTAPFVLTQACRERLTASGHGSIVNIGSIYGLVGPDLRLYAGTAMGNPAAYAAGKGGLLQLTRWLATVLAPRIRVNSISIGGVWRGQPPSFHERYVARTPMGRMATEEDLKGAVAYLASDLSAYVTGHNLVVDGGWTAW